jgi:hypothetical protein
MRPVGHVAHISINRFELNELANLSLATIANLIVSLSDNNYKILNKSHKSFDTKCQNLL